MFALLREDARLDENIGIDFINLNRTSKVLEHSHDMGSMVSTASFTPSQGDPDEVPADLYKANRASGNYTPYTESLNSKF